MTDTLCVVLPGTLAEVRDGRVQIDPKTLAGLRFYSKSWSGDVVLVARSGEPVDPARTTDDWPRTADLPFRVEIHPDVTVAALRHRPTVVLAPLEIDNASLLELDSPCVWVCDYPLRVRWENARIDSSLTRPGRARTAAGLTRRALLMRRMISASAGLQCNGPDTYSAYARHSPKPLMYFDTRVSDQDVRDVSRVTKSSGAHLRLAFSGRWIPQKGVLDAVAALEGLQRAGISCELTLLGGGSLESVLRNRVAPGLTLTGQLPFVDEWVPFVRDHVDVMVLPHPQGDSASTFLESISCGTPVVGYPNRYWNQFHELHGGGWTVPNSTVGSLVETLSELARTPARILEARDRGLAFAVHHTFETEFARRVQHLRDCS